MHEKFYLEEEKYKVENPFVQKMFFENLVTSSKILNITKLFFIILSLRMSEVLFSNCSWLDHKNVYFSRYYLIVLSIQHNNQV